nr:MAG TPA: hypothetical protein [Caudoviricetes sp.]
MKSEESNGGSEERRVKNEESNSLEGCCSNPTELLKQREL